MIPRRIAALALAMLACTATAHATPPPTLAVRADLVLQRFDLAREDGAPSRLPLRGGLARAVAQLDAAPGARIAWRLAVAATHQPLARGEPGDPGAIRHGGLAADVASVEQAWIGGRVANGLTVRAGLLTVPVGPEAAPAAMPDGAGAVRDEPRRRVIPWPWSALGAGASGAAPAHLAWTLAVAGGLDPRRLSADAALRDAHAPLAPGALAHPALAARLAWRAPDATVDRIGGSAVATDATHAALRCRVTLAELDACVQAGPLRGRGLYAMGTIGSHAELARALGVAGTSDAPGKRFFGGYAEAAWSRGAVAPFVRAELTDTQDGVGAIGSEDPSRHRTTWIAGVDVRPRAGVRLALDRQWRHDETRTQVPLWEAALVLAR